MGAELTWLNILLGACIHCRDITSKYERLFGFSQSGCPCLLAIFTMSFLASYYTTLLITFFEL